MSGTAIGLALGTSWKPGSGGGGVALDPTLVATLNWAKSVVATVTHSFTVPSGANRKLIVAIGTDEESQTVSSVKWGGSSGTVMTLVQTIAESKTTLHVYELANPTASTDDIYFTTNSTSSAISTLGLVLQDAKQAAVTNKDTTTGTLNVITTTLTGVSGSMLLAFGAHGRISNTVTTNITMINSADGQAGDAMALGGARTAADGTAQDLTFTFSQPPYRAASVSIEIEAAV